MKARGIITLSKLVTNNVKHFKIKLNKPLNYLSGQWADFDVIKEEPVIPLGGFSFTSYPNTNEIEFLIQKPFKLGKSCTHYLWRDHNLYSNSYTFKKNNHLEVELTVGGTFILNNTTTNSIYLAAGIGITPYLSRLRELINNNDYNELKKISLYWSLKDIYELNMINQDELLLFKNKLKKFNIYITGKHCSHDSNSSLNNNGSYDNTNHFIKNDVILRRMSIEDFELTKVDTLSQIYLCGPPNFVEDIKIKLPINSSPIYEAWW